MSAAAPPAVFQRVLGRRLGGRYHVHSVLATGGMGAVFRALDERLGRYVAVKVLSLETKSEARAAELREWFQREARAAASLRHANVVTVHDFGSDEALGIDFLVMELLPGRDVAGRLKEAGGALPPAEAVEIFREAGMGVAAGHRAGLIHRDVKPRNIFLVEDPSGGWEVKLLDFGIADAVASRTVASGKPGPHTPRYAAPEQLRGEAVSPASDVYALGLTALEMLTGAHPGELAGAADERPAHRAVATACDPHPALRRAIAEVLMGALHPDPARRFPDAPRMLDALESALGTPYGVVRLDPPMPPPRDPTPAPRPAQADYYAPRQVVPDGDPTPPFAAPLEPAPGTRAGVAVPPKDSSHPDAARKSKAAPPAPAQPPAWSWRSALKLYAVVGIIGIGGSFAMMAAEKGVRGAWEAYSGIVSGITDRPAEVREAWPGLAREEVARLEELGYAPGEPLDFRVAQLPLSRAADARALRDELRAAGEVAGAGDSRVYPDLEPGYVYVLIGPSPFLALARRGAELDPLEDRWDVTFHLRGLRYVRPE